MGLENSTVIDAVGIERDSGAFVMSLLDSWTWEDAEAHLSALRMKIDGYLDFIESGQIYAACPDARNRPIFIDVITRTEVPERGTDLLKAAAQSAHRLGVTLRTKTNS